MNKDTKEYRKSLEKFRDYNSIDEYIEDIVTILVHSSWHYAEEKARKQCEERAEFIGYSYEKKVPAYDCAIDVGYCCG